MRRIDLHTPGVKVFGAPFFESEGIFDRIPARIRDSIPQFNPWLCRRCPGLRAAFRTNSKNLKVHMELEELKTDVGMSIFACQSANVYIGDRRTAPMAGLVVPSELYKNPCAEQSYELSGETQDVTVWYPRNEVIKETWFEIDDDAELMPPTPYTYPVPVVFYGSSITEGGCCSRLTNAYNAILSRHLDCDYINMGFSGMAKGELEMADFLCTLNMSVLVMDYDYNSPSAEHLLATHEPFFKRIREHKPELPVLMFSCANPEYRSDGEARHAAVRRTYDNAVAAGDKNVYYIDGKTLFGDADRDMCLTDRTHPTDLGFYRMAMTIEPVLKIILEKTK